MLTEVVITVLCMCDVSANGILFQNGVVAVSCTTMYLILLICIAGGTSLVFGQVYQFDKFSSQPNIVFILTDDQDEILGGMTPMKSVKELLQDKGVTFANMFTPTPLCCPSRSSILTGRYSHNHNVVNNSISGNCSSLLWQKNAEINTFATHAQSAKYRTYFAGKYLNQYGKKAAGGPQHVPHGWDQWFGLVGNSKYYNYTVSDNGNPVHHGDSYAADYLTDLLANKSSEFINQHMNKHFQKPFLLMISTPAPHSPWDAAPQYEKMYINSTAPRGGSFNTNGKINQDMITDSFSKHAGANFFNFAIVDPHDEGLCKDKHWLLRQATNPMTPNSVKYLDNAFRKRWQTLLSVDNLVEKVINDLTETKQLDNTFIIYSSDNGYHLGQFSLPIDKRQLYESDIRVPLIIRGPGVPQNVTRLEPAISLDIAPTIVDIVNGSIGHFPSIMDGTSLLPLLKTNRTTKWRSDFLVEYQGEGEPYPPEGCPHETAGVSQCFPDCVCEDAYNNTYSCVRTLNIPKKIDLMYCEMSDTETFVEIYNHTTDPHQLKNIWHSVDPQILVDMNKRLITLGACVGKACRDDAPV